MFGRLQELGPIHVTDRSSESKNPTEYRKWLEIVSYPGKFEGEMPYAPYFWDAYLNGFFDFERGNVLGWKISKEDKDIFPELRGRRQTVKLYERDDGFVVEV